MQTDSFLPAAERTLRLVELLIEEPAGFSPQDLQTRLDVSRSTLFALLRVLKERGYVTQSEKRGRYRAGARLRAWGAGDLTAAFRQEAAARPFDETLALVSGGGEGAATLAELEPQRAVRASLPAAGAAALYAALVEAPDATTRANGYTLLVEDELWLLAAPVCRDGLRPEAVAALAAPRFRWGAEALLATQLEALRGLAARLSYRVGAPFYFPYRFEGSPRRARESALSAAELAAFLAGPWYARLACVRPDGRPHVIPVWQEWDGQDFQVIAWPGSQWADYVARNPNVSLSVDEPWPPLRRVTVRGLARPFGAHEARQAAELAQRMAQRYMGQALSDEVAGQARSAFYIRPEALRGWRGLAGVAVEG